MASISPGLAGAAAREVWRHVRREGLARDGWGHSVIPAPLSDRAASALGVVRDAALRALPSGLEGPEPEEPQVLLRLPDLDEPWSAVQYQPHVDRTPGGDVYRLVIGVCLSEAVGGTVRLRDDGGWSEAVASAPGDVVWWRGGLEHQGRSNCSSTPRMTVYWRVPRA